jgi:hypothetical protein
LLGDAERLEHAIREHAAADFTDSEIASIVRWCSSRTAAVVDYQDDAEDGEEDEADDEDDVREPGEPPALDGEDDAIFLRLIQAKHALPETPR